MQPIKMVIKSINDISKDAWNSFLIEANASVFNSYEMAFIRKAVFKENPIFLSCEYNGLLIAQIILRESYPDPRTVQSYTPFPSITGMLLRAYFKRIVWDFSPVFKAGTDNEVKKRVILNIFEYLQAQKYRCATGEFGVEEYELLGEDFIKWATYIIQINKNGVEEQLKELPSTTRYQIRRSRRDGIEIKCVKDESSMKEYVYEWGKTWKREGRGTLPPRNRLMKKYFTMNIELESDEYDYLLLGAYYHGQLIGGVGIQIFHKWAGIECFFTSDYARENHLFVGDALIWGAIEVCSEKGIEKLDLIGINPDPNCSSKEKGIAFFKGRWNGEYQEYWKVYKTIPQKIIMQLKNDL